MWLKNVERMLSLRKKFDKHAERAPKNLLRMLSVRKNICFSC
jgi:hypothetical protein